MCVYTSYTELGNSSLVDPYSGYNLYIDEDDLFNFLIFERIENSNNHIIIRKFTL